MSRAEFYECENGKIYCTLCPHMCVIENRLTGSCGIRININGELYSKTYFKVSAVNVDPMEKKPLYHYYPGSRVFSIGASGCNMHCGFCQNYHISQSISSEIAVSAEELIKLAYENHCVGMAYTYTEPFVWFELSYEMSDAARKANLKNIFVTNGNINPEPLNRLMPLMDAANIDVKTFSPEYYKKMAGDLEVIKRNIQTIYANGIHTEITSLLVPDMWNEELFEKMCEWLSGISPFIPLHVNKYFPAYKYDLPPTSDDMLLKYRSIAKKYLKYVYIGNSAIEDISNTVCYECGETLIERSGYEVNMLITEPKCPKCGTHIHLTL